MKLVVNVVAVVVTVVVMMRGGVGMRAASCEPDCTGKDLGDEVMNPRNCSEYYICLGGGDVTDHAVPCSEGKHFDEATHDCILDDPGKPCESPCGGGSLGCHVTCNKTFDLISDISNCSKYFMCLPNGPDGPHWCSKEHPYFNGVECGDDETKCCTRVCEPYCEAPNAAIPDPKDCKRYYFCQEKGKPDEKLHFTCEDGNFDIQLGKCSKDATCTIICNEGSSTTPGGGGGGDSTPPPGCLDSLLCTSAGRFPACNTCQPKYFDCSKGGVQGTVKYCPDGRVFNTNPDYPVCVLPSNCPYPN